MSEQILDTRDLATRLSELQDYQTALDDAQTALNDANAALEAFKSEHPDDEEIDASEELSLESDLAELESAVEDAESELENAKSDFGDDEAEELAELESMESEVSEWRDGNTLIREDYWVDYVKQLLEDIGDLPRNLPSYIAIDWDETADNIKADYSEVTYQGETYYYRVS